MKVKMLQNILMSMEWRGQTCTICQLVGSSECSLTFFEVLQTNTINVHWVPTDLTCTVVNMSVKCRDNANQPALFYFLGNTAVMQGLDKCTHDVVPKRDVGTEPVNQMLCDGDPILHPTTR